MNRYFIQLKRHDSIRIEALGTLCWPDLGENSTYAILGKEGEHLAYHCKQAAGYPYVSSGYSGDIVPTGYPFHVRRNVVFAFAVPIMDLLPRATLFVPTLSRCVVSSKRRLFVPGFGWMELKQRADSTSQALIKLEAVRSDLDLVMHLVTPQIEHAIYAANGVDAEGIVMTVARLLLAYEKHADIARAVVEATIPPSAVPEGVSQEVADFVCAGRAVSRVLSMDSLGLGIVLGSTYLKKIACGTEIPILSREPKLGATPNEDQR